MGEALTPEQAKRNIDALLEEIPQPQAVTDAATLEDLLGEGRRFRRRGLALVAIPPCIQDLAQLLRMLNALESADESDSLRLQTEIARRLFFVEEDSSLRPTTAEEIQRVFPVGALMRRITETMADNGIQMDAEKRGVVKAPDWEGIFCMVCRYYPGYTLRTIAREVTFPQLQALMRQVSKRPYDLVVMVEPKQR